MGSGRSTIVQHVSARIARNREHQLFDLLLLIRISIGKNSQRHFTVIINLFFTKQQELGNAPHNSDTVQLNQKQLFPCHFEYVVCHFGHIRMVEIGILLLASAL